MYKAPICIGGIGGSGTRLFAQILNLDDSIFLGPIINDTDDNLVFTFLFKRLIILKMNETDLNTLFTIFRKVMSSVQLNQNELNIIKKIYQEKTSQDYLYDKKKTYETMINYSNKNYNNITQNWGWKEPNTHILLPFLLKKYKTIKYIHIMRNGLDNAFSKNQNQLKFWTNLKYTPSNSLKYWVQTQKKIIHLQKQYPNNIFIIKFEDFVKYPDKYIPILSKFINKKLNSQKIKSMIKIPNTINQYKNYNLKYFNKEDLEFLKQLNYY